MFFIWKPPNANQNNEVKYVFNLNQQETEIDVGVNSPDRETNQIDSCINHFNEEHHLYSEIHQEQTMANN